MTLRKQPIIALLVALALLTSACASSKYGAAQPTVDAAGANAAMTMTAAYAQQVAAEAQRVAADAAVAQAAPTITAQVARTYAVGTATAEVKTQIAITPTIAAQWTQSALMMQATATADARTAEAIAGQRNETATANALTFEAQAASVHATVTAIAAQAQTDARHATGTPAAMTATAEAVQAREARYQGLEDLRRLFETVVILALAGVVVAAAMLAVAIAAKAFWRLANGPRLVRRRPGEPMPVLLTDERRPVTVHDPARQPAATASTARPGIPAGIPPALQAEVTRLAQQGEIARAFLLLMAGQAHVNGKQVSRGALPPGVSVPMLERLVGGEVAGAAPRVIVLEMFDRGRLVGEGVAPQQVEVIEGEWVDVS